MTFQKRGGVSQYVREAYRQKKDIPGSSEN